MAISYPSGWSLEFRSAAQVSSSCGQVAKNYEKLLA